MGISRSAYYGARDGARRHCHRRSDERHPRRIRTLWLAARPGSPPPARPRGQSQEGQASHARARSPATHASATCGDNGQRTTIRPSAIGQKTCFDGANQLWVADITYVAIAVGFVYVAVILDAWSRRVVGYAISRSIDVRLTLAALKAAIEDASRRPAACIIPTAALQGGFKWSSQHLDGSCDEHSKTALGSFWAGALVLTRSTAGGRARGAAAILGSDCGRHGE